MQKFVRHDALLARSLCLHSISLFYTNVNVLSAVSFDLSDKYEILLNFVCVVQKSLNIEIEINDSNIELLRKNCGVINML